jgi:hypothetical protein
MVFPLFTIFWQRCGFWGFLQTPGVFISPVTYKVQNLLK